MEKKNLQVNIFLIFKKKKCFTFKKKKKYVLEINKKSMSSPLVGKPVFCELLAARNVIKADVVSESDPYVKISLRQTVKSGGCCGGGDEAIEGPLVPNSIEYKWPTIDDEPNPQWNTTVWLAQNAAPGTTLHVKLFDEDATADELLGSARIPVEKLQLDTVITVPLPFTGDKKKIQEVDIRFRAAPTKTKVKCTVIRHGESEWNEAQAEMNISQMTARTDHPLTPLGAAQALGLAKKIKAALDQLESGASDPETLGKHDRAVQSLLNTEVVYVSPLCRAVQTAILGLSPLQQRNGGGSPSWQLRKASRERRNFGGVDSSGTVFGKEFLPFLLKELKELEEKYKSAQQEEENGGGAQQQLTEPFPDRESLEQILKNTDTHECDSKWWTDDREGAQGASRRIADLFFGQVMWDPSSQITLVGHSHFWRDTFVNYFSNSLREKIKNKEEGYGDYPLERWFSQRLSNCGIATIEFDFSPILAAWQQGRAPTSEEMKCIQDITLLFGTTLIP
jgi:broad specificity phosphatase PhoE